MRALKDFALLVSGTVLGTLASLLLALKVDWTVVGLIAAGGAFLIAMYGFSVLDSLLHRLRIAIRVARRNRIRIVGILTEMVWDDAGEGMRSWVSGW